MSVSTVKDADEQEVFEIVDFTTASEWERFTAAVEEILHDWHLTGSDQTENIPGHYTKAEWQEQCVSLNFADFSFTLTHHFKTYELSDEEQKNDVTKDQNNEDSEEIVFPAFLTDMFSYENDFPGKAHCLVRWFGVQQFITLTPANPLQPVVSVSKAKILLSSLGMAANNTNCCIPMFVQMRDFADKLYVGVGYGNGLRTDFEMAYVRTPPAQCTHLSGLLDVFKSKIGSTLTSGPATVSVRFTYILTDWPHTLWMQQPPDFDETLSDIGFSELGRLPFGALSDPISELQLSTTWPCFGEHAVVDTEVQSDLRPSSAPVWSVRLGSSPPPLCLLSEYVSEFLQVCSEQRSIVQILGHEFDPTLDESPSIISALDRLTSPPVPSLSAFVLRGQKKPASRNVQGPLSEEVLSLLLNFLFPDAQSLQEENAAYPDPSSFSPVPPWNPSVDGLPAEHPLQTLLRSMKTCGVDSFVWRLAIVLCHVVHSLGGLPAVAHLYYEILLELRFRWDNSILLQGLSEGTPDMATCLVHQKLQMLNCCVRHRREREHRTLEKSSDRMEEEDEEFYECEEENLNIDSSDGSGKEECFSWDKPKGRLKRFNNVRLLKRKDFLYVPITQEPAPFTEDKLEEQTDELLRLGTDSSGSGQRARLMSSALLSDMESFKAANPGSVLEDFIRWYSPRDWVEEEVSNNDGEKTIQYGLSTRMQIQGNLWQEVWETAKPVPAHRQKRLFDDTREAEKVLQWFNCLSPGELCQQLLAVLLHASLCRLAEEPVLYTLPAVVSESIPHPLHNNSLPAQLELLSQRAVRLSRQPPSISKYKLSFEQVGAIEVSMAKAQSLRLKLLGHSSISAESLKPYSVSNVSSVHDVTKPETESSSNFSSSLESLVVKLLEFPDVSLEGGSNGIQAAAIKKLFSDAKENLFFEEPQPLKAKEKKGPEKWDHRNRETSRDTELGKPAGREYLLRANAEFPADHSRVMPHRLYAVILKNSFRMAGAITQDTLFC